MSLVEIALKKMQSRASPRRAAGAGLREGSAGSPLAPGLIGELVAASPQEGGSPGAARSAPPFRTDKLIRVDRQALRSEGLMPPEHQERTLADQYRQIKRPLIANAFGRGGERLPKGRLIMMASAMPGEGKTFTAINLALSLALEKDHSVVLVDADVPKPHISRTFGLEGEPGLLDVLREQTMEVSSVVVPTDVPGLSVLPAGRRSDTATELLASRRMEAVSQNILDDDHSRIVIVDTPPLLLTSESRALAHAVGQVVLVVQAGSTPQQAVLDSIGYLGEGRFIGLVLNQSTGTPAGYYYGYGDFDRATEP